MLKNMIEFVEKNKKMSIVHIHGNNFDQPDKMVVLFILKLLFKK